MDEFYTIKQAAVILRVHPLTIRRYIQEGKLKAFRAGGNVRIAINDLRSFTKSFIPTQKQSKQPLPTSTNPFSLDDPLLRLKGRGVSIKKLNQVGGI